MTPQPLIVVGAGGHGKVVGEAATASGQYRIAAYADDKYELDWVEDGILRTAISSLPAWLECLPEARVILAVGSNMIRRQLEDRLKLPPERYATVVHPSAIISVSAHIGSGSVVLAGAVMNADARTGAHVIVNSRAVLEHDCVIGDYAHVSPAAALAGGVCVENGAHIGIGACALPGIRIGAWCTLGAGATAIRDVPAGCTAVGVPASHISYRNGHARLLAQAE